MNVSPPGKGCLLRTDEAEIHDAGLLPYFRRGGMEAIYDDVPQPIGLMAFAPVVAARGAMFGASARSGNDAAIQSVLSEEELLATFASSWRVQRPS